MNKNLKLKTIVIVGTLLIFLWGIFLGSDPVKSVEAMKKASAERGFGAAVLAGIQTNIRLGLDLKGGLHMILQVMTDEAVNSDVQRAVERLQTELRSKNIPFSQIATAPDRPDRIIMNGVPPEQSSALRDIATEQLSEYEFASGPDNSLVLTMKPTTVRDIKTRA